ncbi:tail fiber assembly protein [Pseudomonas protegens]|uniref:tail fiber assembly protein n=1 Tax=Pseudomonas protegens TaxID=380021 RepID=UPI0039671CFF
MSYAVRNDLQGCRSINHPDDIERGEHYSEDPLPPVAPTIVELSEATLNQRDGLLVSAAAKMGPLQDAVDEEAATAEEVSLLKRWKQYRIALNRIEQQEGFPASIQWPKSPDENE